MRRTSIGLSAAFMLCLTAGAHAAPPEGRPADPELGRWFQSLQVPAGPKKGWGCCSIADCRTVTYRTRGDAYEVFVKHGTRADYDAFPDGDNLWHVVGEDHILRRHDNPTGEAVACYWQHEVLCLVLPWLT